ncbi:MAG: hypothetical protein PUB37_06925 [Firmicutes bacterium]|nr:hypothetical protein [Bacillota bacterium]
MVGTTVTNYTLEGDKVVHETNGTDELWYYYDEGGNLVSFELNGTSYYYVKNLQGDIIAKAILAINWCLFGVYCI